MRLTLYLNATKNKPGNLCSRTASLFGQLNFVYYDSIPFLKENTGTKDNSLQAVKKCPPE